MSEPTPASPPADDQPSAVPIDQPAEPTVDRWSASPARWTVPATVAEVPGAPGLAFADISSRLVAFAIDAAILGIAGASLAIALGLGERIDAETSSYVWLSGATVEIAFIVLGFAYFVFFWTGGRRATIGQRVFDIQVGNAFDGRPLGLDQAVRRWLGYGSLLGLLVLVPNLRGYDLLAQLAWVLVLLASTGRSPMKQGVHDRFARSALVRPADRGSGGPAMACLVIVILLGVLFIAGVVALILLGSRIGPVTGPPGTAI